MKDSPGRDGRIETIRVFHSRWVEGRADSSVYDRLCRPGLQGPPCVVLETPRAKGTDFYVLDVLGDSRL